MKREQEWYDANVDDHCRGKVEGQVAHDDVRVVAPAKPEVDDEDHDKKCRNVENYRKKCLILERLVLKGNHFASCPPRLKAKKCVYLKANAINHTNIGKK